MVNAQTRLLVICPSRSRPERISEMIRSFEETRSAGTELVIYLADDDPCLDDYVITGDHKVLIGRRRTIVEVFNYCSVELFPNIPYYADANDDHIYQTPNWDSRLISEIELMGGYGLACPNDKLTEWEKFKHPSAAVVDGNVVRILGRYFHKNLSHLGADTYLGLLFQGLGRLKRCEDVVVEHRHHLVNPDLMDETYLLTYGANHKKNSISAKKIIDDWKIWGFWIDICKISLRFAHKKQGTKLFLVALMRVIYGLLYLTARKLFRLLKS